MSWRALVMCLCAVWCAACGPTPPPNTGGTAPDVDEPCAASGAACQPGLVCNAQGLCDWARCEDAPDPRAWCAGQLGVDAERAACEVDGCVVIRSGAGQPCQDDAGCHAGLVCAQQVCVALCASSASCPGADRACVERAPGSPQSICGPRPACDATPDPLAFCADLLGVDPSSAECAPDGRCQLERSSEGAWCTRDRACLDGLVCEGNLCTRACDGACAEPSYVCLPRPSGGEGRLCQYVAQGCAAVPDPQVYCEATRGAGSRCNYDSGECSEPPPPPPRYFDMIIIRDMSAPASCAQRTAEGLLEPGADIVSLEVFDERGERVELSLEAALSVDPQDNNFSSPDLNVSSQRAAMFGMLDPVCPARRAEDGRHELDGMVSLGCGGVISVRFYQDTFGGSGEFALYTGMKLRVGEYAPVCDGQSGDVDPDAYTVTLCERGTASCEQLESEPVRGTVWLDVP